MSRPGDKYASSATVSPKTMRLRQGWSDQVTLGPGLASLRGGGNGLSGRVRRRRRDPRWSHSLGLRRAPNLDETKILQSFHQLWIIDRRVCIGRDLNVFEHSLRLILNRAGFEASFLCEPAHVGAHGVHSKATARLTFRSHIVDESVGFPLAL